MNFRGFVSFLLVITSIPSWFSTLIPCLEAVRDVFFFCCFLDLRYSDVYNLRLNDIKGDQLQRIDDTSAHRALREAIVNTIIHARLNSMHSIVIEHYPDRLVFRNPGSLLVSVEQYFEGGTSICRNSILQKMFEFIGEGERAGSGVDTIKKGWKDNGWAEPVVREIEDPEQVELTLPLGSLGSGVDYQETTKSTTKTTTKTPLGPTAQSIVDLLKAEPDLNASQIAEKLSLRIDNTRFHIRSLKKKGILIHVGPDNNGHWEVVDRQ